MKIKNPYRSQFNAGTLLDDADVTLVASQFVEIGRYTVPAGTGICLGYGGLTGQDNSIGRVYMDLIDDAAGDEQGLIRIELRNPQDRTEMVLWEGRSEALRTLNATPDFAEMLPFPQMADMATEDWAFVVLMKADAADVLNVSACTVMMDYTVFEVRQ